MIRETAPTPANIQYIIANLRERDFKEIMALRWDDDLDLFMFDTIGFAGAMWRVWERDGEPIAIGGVTPVRPGVVSVGAFGTKDWHYAARQILTWGRRWVVPRLLAANFHRGEAYALASNTDSRRFIEALGGEIEAVLHHYGRKREDFILYAWRLDDVHRWRQQGQQSAVTEGGQTAVRAHHWRRSRVAARSH